MNPPAGIGSWPVLRQLTGPDGLGRAAAVKSRGSASLEARTATADRVVKSICPYCAVGCAQNVYVRDEKVVHVEGDPDSPVSRGRLCPKGAATLQLTTGSGRMHKVLYRAPYAADWQELDLGIEGSNFAEAHPVGFQWVMEAKARGATVIHVDPRFTRTSALADLHVPIRTGTDVAFLGGIINHVLANDLYFREFVVDYTNAATIVGEDFRDTEDLDGLFSGFDPDNRGYDTDTWQYEGMTVVAASGKRDEEYDRRTRHGSSISSAGRGEMHGSGGAALEGTPRRDETMEDPRCVLQILKRHYSRYTPEMVERICGIPRELFAEVCRHLVENSGPERTAEFVYAVGWTQHGDGSQFIRAAWGTRRRG